MQTLKNSFFLICYNKMVNNKFNYEVENKEYSEIVMQIVENEANVRQLIDKTIELGFSYDVCLDELIETTKYTIARFLLRREVANENKKKHTA